MIKLVNYDTVVDITPFATNGEWELLFTSTFNTSLGSHGEAVPMIGFTLGLKRIPDYFIYNIVMPITMLMVLSVVVYILPAEAGEKIGLQITILLAFSVMLLIMSDNTPKAGAATPILSKYQS